MKRIKRYIVFDGQSSLDFDIDLTNVDSYKRPERDTDTTSVPGRNGELTYDNGRYQNITITYGCKLWRASAEKFSKAFNSFTDFLLSHQDTYYRLEDNMDSEYFRLARFTEGIDPEIKDAGDGPRYAKFDMKFDCKPQHFLKSGEIVTTVSSGSTATLHNPTCQAAKPLIRIYCTGSGTVGVGSETVTIAKGAASYIDLDCDLHLAYEGTKNRGSLVTLTDWPVLKANGDTGITMSGNVTKVEITPRWFTI